MIVPRRWALRQHLDAVIAHNKVLTRQVERLHAKIDQLSRDCDLAERLVLVKAREAAAEAQRADALSAELDMARATVLRMGTAPASVASGSSLTFGIRCPSVADCVRNCSEATHWRNHVAEQLQSSGANHMTALDDEEGDE